METIKTITYRSYGAQQPPFIWELLTWRASGTKEKQEIENEIKPHRYKVSRKNISLTKLRRSDILVVESEKELNKAPQEHKVSRKNISLIKLRRSDMLVVESENELNKAP